MKFLRRFFSGKPGANITVAPAKSPLGGVLRGRGVRWDVENETDRLADEQVQIWQADGIKASTDSYSSAAAVTPLADGVREVQSAAWRRVEETAEALSEATHRLRGYTPMTTAETRRYWITLAILAASDIFSVASGLVVLGDMPLMAFFQALGPGTAAATAGLAASLLRKRQMAHLFEAEHAPAGENGTTPFTVLGLDPDDMLLRIALAVAVAITVASFALRWVQGPGAAVGYGLFSFVLCAGSFINSYIHARPAAEILQGLESAHERAKSSYLALSGHESISSEAASLSQAHSIEAEHAARGEAARQHVLAQLWAIFRRHVRIYGHGVEASPPPMVSAPVVSFDGRTAGRHHGAGDRHIDLSARPLNGRR